MKALIILTAMFLAAISLNNILKVNPITEIEKSGIVYDYIQVTCSKDSCTTIGKSKVGADTLITKR